MIWTAIETTIDANERVYDSDQEPMNVSVMEMTTNDSIMEMSIDESIEESPIGTVYVSSDTSTRHGESPIGRGYASSDTSTRHDLTLEVAIMPGNEVSRISLSEVDTSVEPVPSALL